MQHREIITQKLESIEGRISRMESMLSRGSSSQFKMQKIISNVNREQQEKDKK